MSTAIASPSRTLANVAAKLSAKTPKSQILMRQEEAKTWRKYFPMDAKYWVLSVPESKLQAWVPRLIMQIKAAVAQEWFARPTIED